MHLLGEYPFALGLVIKSLRLYQGDLAAMSPAENVDCLVVSAFPDDYAATPTSLIGALARQGISVQQLSEDKEQDLRDSFSCWISKDLRPRFPSAAFRRLLCFEPLIRGNPAELTSEVFSALMPFVLGDPPIRSVAMPVLAAGDQRFDDVAMFESLFRAAVWWLRSGMPVETVKIVVHSDAAARRLEPVFRALKHDDLVATQRKESLRAASTTKAFDCFISYSHDDSIAVDQVVSVLTQAVPGIRIFRDKPSIPAGASWQSRIDEALEHTRKVITLYSPSYLQSPMCKEEFNLARIRHRESNESVLVPIYLRSANLPLYMRSINYIDCREADMGLVQSCGSDLCAALA